MSVTVLSGDDARTLRDAREAGDHLWVSGRDLEATTGWALKPEGLCLNESCVPLPADGSWIDTEGRVDLAAFSRHQGRPIVHDEAHSVWVVGSSTGRADGRLSLEAPDFRLPDLTGRLHSLSEFRGKKVFLFAWASY